MPPSIVSKHDTRGLRAHRMRLLRDPLSEAASETGAVAAAGLPRSGAAGAATRCSTSAAHPQACVEQAWQSDLTAHLTQPLSDHRESTRHTASPHKAPTDQQDSNWGSLRRATQRSAEWLGQT